MSVVSRTQCQICGGEADNRSVMASNRYIWPVCDECAAGHIPLSAQIDGFVVGTNYLQS